MSESRPSLGWLPHLDALMLAGEGARQRRAEPRDLALRGAFQPRSVRQRGFMVLPRLLVLHRRAVGLRYPNAARTIGACMFVDVHTHLTHRAFEGEEDAVAHRAAQAGLDCVIVNGLEPASNRAVLALCSRHPHLFPALGIYPVDVVARFINPDSWEHEFPPPTVFDVDEEIDFIDSVADDLIAIGECGLDQYWVVDQPEEQERVLRRFCEVARTHDKPMIVHTRKAEERTFEILQEMKIDRADFHCFGGKLKLAQRIAQAGYHLSIPTVVERAQAFQRMVEALPLERLLTETDAPYMGPDRGTRNEPATVPRAVAAMAAIRGMPSAELRDIIRLNCKHLFGV